MSLQFICFRFGLLLRQLLFQAYLIYVSGRCKVGSIKAGKDADLVVWSDNPLSIYAKAEKTMVDGIIYFDREKDAQMRKQVQAERSRLIAKMAGEKRAGRPTVPAAPSFKEVHICNDHSHKFVIVLGCFFFTFYFKHT